MAINTTPSFEEALLASERAGYFRAVREIYRGVNDISYMFTVEQFRAISEVLGRVFEAAKTI